MEELLIIEKEIESISRQIDREGSTLNLLYCQKSLQEAKFWLSTEIDKRKNTNP